LPYATFMRILLLFTLLPLTLLSSANSVAAQNRADRIPDASATVMRAIAYHPAIRAAAERYSVDPHVLWTIAYLETRFRPQLVSHKGARGLMQFIPATGRRYGLLTRNDLHDPLRSIDAAARYVRDLDSMFAGRIDLVLAGYNAGENAVINSGYRVPPYRETRSYVARGVSVFRRITQSNILSLEPGLQVQTPQVTQTGSSNNPSALRYQPAPSGTQSARSIYFRQ
jgi:soluble lytic murein transglycosylase-like protein